MYIAIGGRTYVTAQALYVTTGEYANPSIRCGATVSVILPVMPDVLDIVIVLQHINELLHILQVALIREGDVVLGLLPQGVQRFFDCCFQPNKLLPVTH